MGGDPVSIAILAKAPAPGTAKTRLIPELGAHGAAFLHERMIEHAVAAACEAQLGRVAVWATNPTHAFFSEIARSFPVLLRRQGRGDLGARMLAALTAAEGPALVIGADCPALTAEHLRRAASALGGGQDAVFIPVEDGGYVLVGMRRPVASLFTDMVWGVSTVMAETRRRLAAAGLTWRELEPLWDVDTPADLARLSQLGWTI